MEKSKFWKYVALGVAGVLLVFFLTNFFLAFGEKTREKMDIRDAFTQIKVEEALSQHNAGIQYITLNWHEFSDKVVIQLGNNSRDLGNNERGHIQKDRAYWYYIFNKDNNTLNLEGVYRVGKASNLFKGWTTYNYLPVGEKNKFNVDVLGMLQHEFENIYTGDILNSKNTLVSSNTKWVAPGRLVAEHYNSTLYLTADASTYVPADNSYRISLYDASLTSPIFFKQCYDSVNSADVILDVSEKYFCCYSNSVAKEYTDSIKGYVAFDLRVYIDYTPHLTTRFDFENLDSMYELIKDYNYYNG